MKKFQSFWNEKWEPIEQFVKSNKVYYPKHEYKVSNLGRVIRKKEGEEEFKLLNHHKLSKYKVVIIVTENDQVHQLYVHRLLGEYFLEKPSEDHNIVAFKNYDLSDLRLGNLAWMTKKEHSAHVVKSPAFKEAHRQKSTYKLTEERVRLIKRIIFDPNRKTRMKSIAKQFGISEMQLYRIKSGENWGHVDPLD